MTLSAREALLRDINEGVPDGIDWYAGAFRYVKAEFEKHGREAYLHYLLTKPLSPVSPGVNGGAALVENIAYLSNFVNTARLLNLPGRAKVLDVACGSGRVSHFLSLMNYDAHGFDICDDMVDLTRRKLRQEPMRFCLLEEPSQPWSLSRNNGRCRFTTMGGPQCG